MIRPENVKKILFITLSNIGDIILTTPVFQKLHREYPGAVIDVVSGSSAAEIFASHAFVGKVMLARRNRRMKDRLRELMSFRRDRYDLVVDLKRSLIPCLSGARYHNGFSFVRNRHAREHKVFEHLAALKGLVKEPFADRSFCIPVSGEDERNVRASLAEGRGKRKVALNPGSRSLIKRWSPERCSELIERMVREFDCDVYLTGGSDEEPLGQEISRASGENFVNMVGRTSLGGLFFLYRNMDLVVSCDSAPLHVASAAGVPTVAIFGPTDEKRYGPLSGRSEVVRTGHACRPCGKAACELEGAPVSCMDLAVEDVMSAVRRML